MTFQHRIILYCLSIILVGALIAPIGIQWVDMDLVENITMEESETEEKEKELEEKEKYSQQEFGLSLLDYSSSIKAFQAYFALPHPPYIETNYPPPDFCS